MCCKTSVFPFDAELAAAILTIGQFVPKVPYIPGHEIPKLWNRDIPEENSTVNVSLNGDMFEINIMPPINSFNQHLGKRITAGIYFEIAAKYAEKVGGEIIQRSTVVGCRDTPQGTGLVVAQYPVIPMSFERVCVGFQQVLLNGHHFDGLDPDSHPDLGNPHS